MPDSSVRPAATVDDVLITTELSYRASRPPDYKAESLALVELAKVMADTPDRVLQKLAQTALELCRAGSAGVSVWEPGSENVFRWRATAGEYTPYLGGTLPRFFSPCGTVLDRCGTQLMADPVRFYPYIAELNAPVREVLLVPFYRAGEAIGTVWVVSHTDSRHFDGEDERLVTTLTRFAEAAVQTLSRIVAAERAEANRQDVQNRLEATLAAGEVATWTWDVKADRVAADRNLTRLFGVPDVEADGSPIARFIQAIHPDDRAPTSELIRLSMETGEPYEARYRVRHADGEYRTVVARGKPEYDSERLVFRLPGVVLDITRQVRAEEQLRAATDRLHVALRAGRMGAWDLDLATLHMTCSDACKANYGRRPDEAFTYEELASAVHEDDRERWRGAVADAVSRSGEFEVEYRVRWPDGDMHWVHVRGNYTSGTSGPMLSGVSLDITDRKRADELLRTSEERRRLALDAAELGSWHLDPALMAFTTDERFRAMFEISSGELDYEAAVARIHPDDQQRVREAVAAAIRPDDPVPYEIEYRIALSDAGVRWVFAKGRPNFEGTDMARRLVSFDGTLADVTEQKRIGDSLRQLAADLSDADRRKDEFLATLAHELRNPLAPIRNGLQVLTISDKPEARERAVAMMSRQLGQMVRLVDDLMDVSRISRGKLELRRERVPLADVLRSAVETSRPLIDQMSHELMYTPPARDIIVDADLTRLAQVFLNLLNNAAKYMERGGHIWLSAQRQGSGVVVSVRDTGIGIAADQLPRIFDLFSQVDRSLEKAQGGLGIGLTLVRRLTEMHGGSIEARSDGPGKGSEFLISLPTVETATILAGRHEDRPSPTAQRILIVDDNRDGADSLSEMMALFGNDTRTAYDGVAAVEAAASFLPDVILLDIGLPKLNGYEACRRIRAHRKGRQPVIIAQTGWGADEDRQRTREAGFDHHLVKPVDPGELLTVLARISG